MQYHRKLFFSWDKSISGLAAAILDIRLKTTFGDVACSTVKSGIPENMGIELGISFLVHPYVDIKHFTFFIKKVWQLNKLLEWSFMLVDRTIFTLFTQPWIWNHQDSRQESFMGTVMGMYHCTCGLLWKICGNDNVSCKTPAEMTGNGNS